MSDICEVCYRWGIPLYNNMLSPKNCLITDIPSNWNLVLMKWHLTGHLLATDPADEPVPYKRGQGVRWSEACCSMMHPCIITTCFSKAALEGWARHFTRRGSDIYRVAWSTIRIAINDIYQNNFERDLLELLRTYSLSDEHFDLPIHMNVLISLMDKLLHCDRSCRVK